MTLTRGVPASIRVTGITWAGDVVSEVVEVPEDGSVVTTENSFVSYVYEIDREASERSGGVFVEGEVKP